MRYLYWIKLQLAYLSLVYLVSTWLWVITYPFHDKIERGNVLWWFLGDHPIGYAWYWTKFGIPLGSPEPTGLKRFWIAYNWSVWRNGCWRLFTHGFLKQDQGDKENLEVITNESYDGKNLSPDTVLRMKFKTNGVPTDNVGDSIDLEKTFQGKSFIKYTIGNKKYFLYTYCKASEDKGKEFTIGWNGKRPIIRNKKYKK